MVVSCGTDTLTIWSDNIKSSDVSTIIDSDDITLSGWDFVQITASESPDYGYITLSATDDINLKTKNVNISGTLKKGSYTYSLPSKSGIFALTDDIPNLSINSSLYMRIQELTIDGFNNITNFNIEDCKYIKIIPFESNVDDRQPATWHISYRSDFSRDYITISGVSSTNYLFPIEITRNNVDSQNYNIHIKYSTISNNIYTIRSNVYYSANDVFNNLYFEFDTMSKSEYLKVLIITIEK